MVLENAATSIKVLVGAHVNLDSNIRAFYCINNREGVDPIFTAFPGYNNLNSRGQMILGEDSDGLSDTFVPPTNNY